MSTRARDAEVPGSHRDALPGAVRKELWSRAEAGEVSVLLRRAAPLPAPDGSAEWSGPLGHRKYLSPRDFGPRYGATEADLDAVREFAGRKGLSVRESHGPRRTVRLAGTLGDLGDAFGVKLYRYVGPSGSYRGREGPVRVPATLGERVVGVFGLDNRPIGRSHVRQGSSRATAYTALQVGAAYLFPAGATGAGECIGLLELGGGFHSADLERYFHGLSMAPPAPVVVGVDGATNSPTGNPNGADAEVELDIELSGALAPGARIAVYFAPNTEQGFVDAMTTAMHDTTNRPTAVSVSWGSPEESWTAQARSALESAAQDGAALGVTLLAAAGDQGAADGEPAGTRTVDFPAASPYVVGCGGTRLTLSGTRLVSEVVWNDLAQGEGATGGGVSELFARPAYQSSSDVPPAPNGFAGRGVPDVAADADPETGYSVVVDASSLVLGGTSAAAPLWAALVARLAQALGKPLGYAQPLLYSPAEAQTFRDIVSGGNGGYSAGPGWDACTGLGTPRGTPLLAALEG